MLDLVSFNDGVDLAAVRLPGWPHFFVRSYDVLGHVREFADDPEWAQLASLPTYPTCGTVIVYRTGGRHGFLRPKHEARQILSHYPEFRIDSSL